MVSVQLLWFIPLLLSKPEWIFWKVSMGGFQNPNIQNPLNHVGILKGSVGILIGSVRILTGPIWARQEGLNPFPEGANMLLDNNPGHPTAEKDGLESKLYLCSSKRAFWRAETSLLWQQQQQALKARRCDSYLQIWNYQSLTDPLTHWLTGVGARRCYCI